MISVMPKECDICHDKIGLYQPWYTIKIKGCFIRSEKVKKNPMSLCPNCFHAYENFLVEREVQENHKQNYIDIKNQ